MVILYHKGQNNVYNLDCNLQDISTSISPIYVNYRKASMPKILSVVNAVYKSENSGDENLYLQNFTEYSEIPDCMIKISSEVGLYFLFFVQKADLQLPVFFNVVIILNLYGLNVFKK